MNFERLLIAIQIAILDDLKEEEKLPRILTNFGAVLLKGEGEEQTAERMLRRALQVWLLHVHTYSEQFSPLDKSVRALALCHLARACLPQEKFGEANTALLEALQLRSEMLGPNHASTIRVQDMLKELSISWGRFRAEQAAKQAKAAAEAEAANECRAAEAEAEVETEVVVAGVIQAEIEVREDVVEPANNETEETMFPHLSLSRAFLVKESYEHLQSKWEEWAGVGKERLPVSKLLALSAAIGGSQICGDEESMCESYGLTNMDGLISFDDFLMGAVVEILPHSSGLGIPDFEKMSEGFVFLVRAFHTFDVEHRGVVDVEQFSNFVLGSELPETAVHQRIRLLLAGLGVSELSEISLQGFMYAATQCACVLAEESVSEDLKEAIAPSDADTLQVNDADSVHSGLVPEGGQTVPEFPKAYHDGHDNHTWAADAETASNARHVESISETRDCDEIPCEHATPTTTQSPLEDGPNFECVLEVFSQTSEKPRDSHSLHTVNDAIETRSHASESIVDDLDVGGDLDPTSHTPSVVELERTSLTSQPIFNDREDGDVAEKTKDETVATLEPSLDVKGVVDRSSHTSEPSIDVGMEHTSLTSEPLASASVNDSVDVGSVVERNSRTSEAGISDDDVGNAIVETPSQTSEPKVNDGVVVATSSVVERASHTENPSPEEEANPRRAVESSSTTSQVNTKVGREVDASGMHQPPPLGRPRPGSAVRKQRFRGEQAMDSEFHGVFVQPISEDMNFQPTSFQTPPVTAKTMEQHLGPARFATRRESARCVGRPRPGSASVMRRHASGIDNETDAQRACRIEAAFAQRKMDPVEGGRHRRLRIPSSAGKHGLGLHYAWTSFGSTDAMSLMDQHDLPELVPASNGHKGLFPFSPMSLDSGHASVTSATSGPDTLGKSNDDQLAVVDEKPPGDELSPLPSSLSNRKNVLRGKLRLSLLPTNNNTSGMASPGLASGSFDIVPAVQRTSLHVPGSLSRCRSGNCPLAKRLRAKTAAPPKPDPVPAPPKRIPSFVF